MKEKVIKWFYSLFDNSGLTELEKETLKRIKKDTEIIAEKKEKKPSLYVGISNRLFSDFSTRLMGGDLFKGLPKDLVKANLDFLPKTYVSIIISTTLLSVIVAVLLLFSSCSLI